MTTRVLGVKDLQSEIAHLSKVLESLEDPAAVAMGEVVAAKWRSLVPVLDGHYRDSIQVGQTKKGTAVGITWLGNLPRNQQPVMYAKRLEFGYSGTTAQPSARPAAEQSRAEAVAAGRDTLLPAIKGRRPRKRVPTQ